MLGLNPLGEVAVSCILSRQFAMIALAGVMAIPALAEDFPALTYSPWIKFCLSDTCFIGRDGRSDVECPVDVAAVFIDQQGDAKKMLRVTLSKRVNTERGVRIAIDQSEAVERPFGSCYPGGCMADYVAGAELVDQLKQGKMIALKAFDKANAPISQVIPLAGFADAYDGPAKEPKMIEKVMTPELRAEFDRQQREQEERKARCDAR